jgi:LPPG:FO 2-phospho-L-lactate transferase
VTDALTETTATTVAISPIVGSDAVSGPAGRLMAASGLAVSAVGIARAYARWLDVLVFDEQDQRQAADIRALDVSPVTAHTVMASHEDEVTLARRTLDALR